MKKLLLSLMALFVLTANANERTRMPPQPELPSLTQAWNTLECGERYKGSWPNNVKTHRELLAEYDKQPADTKPDGKTPYEFQCNLKDNRGNPAPHKDYFLSAVQQFKALVATEISVDHKESAQWGLQESFNNLVEARLLKGNNLLINGLRARFTSTDDPDQPRQIEYLRDSAIEMNEGLVLSTSFLRSHAEILRKGGVGNFPFMVDNSKGIDTPNEYHRYTELVNRYGLSAFSEAKYLFYKDNIKDIDNPPYKNFPGPEDVDFNNDHIQNEAGRIDAAKKAKQAANKIYLQTALLASLQDQKTFQQNNGYQVKRQLNDADRLYQDIQSGFNPLLLTGDFVPYQKIENLLNLASSRVKKAVDLEKAARGTERQLEVDQTALRNELRAQTTQYIDKLMSLTGVSAADFDYEKLYSQEDRQAFRELSVQSTLYDLNGTIGVQELALREADLQRATLFSQLQGLKERVEIEIERNNKMVTLLMANGEKISALQYANTMASCCNVSTGTSTGRSKGTSKGRSKGNSKGISVSYSLSVSTGVAGVTNGFSVGHSRGQSTGSSSSTSEGESWGTSEGTSRNPNVDTLAKGQSAMALLQATQQAKLDGIQSDSLLRNLFTEMATINVSLEQAGVSIQRHLAIIDTLFDELDRTLANYVVAQEHLAEAYYSDPAYRIEATRTEQASQDAFETAIELSYYAAKALEYQWSEKFNNPVIRLDGGLPEPLSIVYDPYVRAESVFSSQFAGSFAPNIDDFLSSLQAWDVKMRQLRYPNRQVANIRLSLRDDILGFGQFIPSVAEAKFRAFIESNRTVGENITKKDLQFDFSLDISDERLLPNHPNIKIESIKVNLVSSSIRSIRGSDNMAPALVDLIQLDRAFVRTFFAEYPARDDILTYQLQAGRTVDKSPFIATVDASIDGFASPEATANTQLANHSPSVSAWVLRMRNNRYNNKDLQLEYLSDIELELQYSFGKPRDIQFFQ